SALNHASHIIHQIIINQKEIDLEVRTYLFSNDLNSSPDIDFESENRKIIEAISLYESMTKNNSEIISLVKKKSIEFLKISSETIKLHDQNIIDNKELNDILSQEKKKRYAIKEFINNSEDLQTREKYALMMYYSKEALFQYKDEKHLQEWDAVVHNLLEDFIAEDNKVLINEMSLYESYIHDLSNRLIHNEYNKINEFEKIKKLEKIEDDISSIQAQINTIQTERQKDIEDNLNFLALAFMLSFMLLVISIGYLLSNTISEPIKRLTDDAIEIARGDYKKRILIHSNNEIGKTAKIINTMLDNLEEVRDVLEIKVKARTKKLEILAADLENKVEKRTKEIKEKIKELEKFNELAVGRELVMIKLKEQIKDLKKNNASYIDDNQKKNLGENGNATDDNIEL
ncbi:HAMP domain-containing protein, partial [Candidatus Parcubacteria bacterium]|nr:HAMP domain-containing protein [Candidatus Parcubacteria bacterium]